MPRACRFPCALNDWLQGAAGQVKNKTTQCVPPSPEAIAAAAASSSGDALWASVVGPLPAFAARPRPGTSGKQLKWACNFLSWD